MPVIESELRSVRGMSNRSHTTPSGSDWRPEMRTSLVMIIGPEPTEVHATRSKLFWSPLENLMPNINFFSVN
jgi:hypothetical protein